MPEPGELPPGKLPGLCNYTVGHLFITEPARQVLSYYIIPQRLTRSGRFQQTGIYRTPGLLYPAILQHLRSPGRNTALQLFTLRQKYKHLCITAQPLFPAL